MISSLSINDNYLIDHFKCEICQGFIIDATTIADCFHLFCKTCIVIYLETDVHRCPTCNKPIKDPTNCIQPDPIYQRLIYKFVPGLLKDEVKRREQFYLELKREKNDLKAESILISNSIVNLKLDEQKKLKIDDDDDEVVCLKNFHYSRYLQCNANTPLRILIKLLRNKYNIANKYQIKLKYMDQELDECETLMEIFICFMLKKNSLLELKYELCLLESTVKTANLKNNNNNNDKCSIAKIKISELQSLSTNTLTTTSITTTQSPQSSLSLPKKEIKSSKIDSSPIPKSPLSTVSLLSADSSLLTPEQQQESIIKKGINKEFLKLKLKRTTTYNQNDYQHLKHNNNNSSTKLQTKQHKWSLVNNKETTSTPSPAINSASSTTTLSNLNNEKEFIFKRKRGRPSLNSKKPINLFKNDNFIRIAKKPCLNDLQLSVKEPNGLVETLDNNNINIIAKVSTPLVTIDTETIIDVNNNNEQVKLKSNSESPLDLSVKK